eukprot:gnl/MRDRNA2_/MRDRNA2_105573_c0_seq1.p1 gnl/MRDRNA2_/MRDRNA2_105573_c0~~gnl/MRDRNA2_/MRDRNA2_105573_c0_seq1.p1  ORF type:complete len:355 (-),score=80.12 gnl/MRDRNA2_/MRDRNA2_105573_c0_seq1:245-1234(-)
MVATRLNIDTDVEEATSRVTVMNTGILKRSVGIGANTFPKTYKVKGTWTAWALMLVGLVAVISPKIIVPLVYGREVWQVSIWNGFYQPFIGLYACLVCFLLAFKIPCGLVREADALIVEFFCRKIRIALSDVDEVRVVRKWKVQDTTKQIVDAAPEFVGPCIGAQGKGYEEVGAPKQRLKAVPFSLCDPCSCIGSKIYWGAPGKSKEVCIISLKNSTYGNFMLDLKDLDGFIRDNRADYSNVTPNGVAPQIVGAKSIDEKKGVVASPASTTASASPLSSMASPMSDYASPVAGVAHPMFTVGASGLATQFETLAEELSSGEESPGDNML